MEAARKRFVNRIQNRLFDAISYNNHDVMKEIANEIGLEHEYSRHVDFFVKGDFYRCLQAIEAIYRTDPTSYSEPERRRKSYDSVIQKTISDSEIDLGIEWKSGHFQRTGAGNLDRTLVNDELRWLSSPKYERVLGPFDKGLRHLLESAKRPELLFDVITDMYEAVEALAKIITGREGRDLSGNAELFLSKIKASPKYKTILKDYIDYANDFRHPPEKGEARKPISQYEAESFVYLTGLFIRIAQQSHESM